jgi:tripartite-type tricarboxylate transporter receptor subunit TctC
MSRIAGAQAYPTRSVRLVVGFPAGGANDIYARLIADWLSKRFGRSFIVEDRPGAASNIATDAVAHAPADGYTLLEFSTTNAINQTLYDKLRFDFIRDIAPVAGMASSPFAMIVNPSFPAKTVPEFIAYAKANPGRISMASVGTGNTTHVSGELFKMMTGVDMVHVPYRDLPYSDLIAGRVQVYFSPVPASIEYIRAGTLRALAVTATSRVDALPDIPTMADFIPGFDVSGWWARQKKRQPRSSTSSTRRSMRASPIPRSTRGLPIWGAHHLCFRLAPSGNSLPRKWKSGPR